MYGVRIPWGEEGRKKKKKLGPVASFFGRETLSII